MFLHQFSEDVAQFLASRLAHKERLRRVKIQRYQKVDGFYVCPECGATHRTHKQIEYRTPFTTEHAVSAHRFQAHGIRTSIVSGGGDKKRTCATIDRGDGLHYSPYTLFSYFRVMSSLFKFAVRRKLIDENPFASLLETPPRVNVVCYSDAELKYYFDFALKMNPPLYFQLLFLLFTAVRSQESCDMLLEQLKVDPATNELEYWNQKAKRTDRFQVTPDIRNFVENLPRDFAPFAFKYRTYKDLYKAQQKVRKACGLTKKGLAIHALKKTFANIALRVSHGDIHTTSALSHHTSVAVTEAFYLELVNKARAAEVATATTKEIASIIGYLKPNKDGEEQLIF